MIGSHDKPAGTVRLLVPRLPIERALAPRLGEIAKKYPEIVLDVTTDDRRRDIVAGGFDAGIHFGAYIQKDMIAVRVSTDHRTAIVASPSYFKGKPRLQSPGDPLTIDASTSVTMTLDFIAESSRRVRRNFRSR